MPPPRRQRKDWPHESLISYGLFRRRYVFGIEDVVATAPGSIVGVHNSAVAHFQLVYCVAGRQKAAYVESNDAGKLNAIRTYPKVGQPAFEIQCPSFAGVPPNVLATDISDPCGLYRNLKVANVNLITVKRTVATLFWRHSHGKA